jgi:hypothetical protein
MANSLGDREAMAGDIVVSKLDAARRQLETASRLYFANGDAVSIHTLTAAAFNLLADLRKHHGKDATVFRDELLARVKPEFVKAVTNLLRNTENFFKHADRDPAETLCFNPGSTEFMLWEACIMYTELTNDRPDLIHTFYCWFLSRHPYFLLPVSGSLRALFTAAPGWPNMTPRSTRWRNEDGYQQSSGR